MGKGEDPVIKRERSRKIRAKVFRIDTENSVKREAS